MRVWDARTSLFLALEDCLGSAVSEQLPPVLRAGNAAPSPATAGGVCFCDELDSRGVQAVTSLSSILTVSSFWWCYALSEHDSILDCSFKG